MEQRRNAYSYIADLDAEHDLYFKTESMLKFLEAWTPATSSSSLSHMFTELYTALYEREYIHTADVQLSRMWIEERNAAGYSFPQVPNSCTHESSEVITEGSLFNTTLIVRINHGLGAAAANRYLEVWSDALQRYGISHIIFYGGNLMIQDVHKPYGHLAVHICENNEDPTGILFYHLQCYNNFDLLRDVPSDGYVFAHDDSVLDLRRLSRKHTNQSWFTFAGDEGVDMSNLTGLDVWWAGNAPRVHEALENKEFSKLYADSLWNCSAAQGLVLKTAGGTADTFFISGEQIAEYLTHAANFARFSIFLEIALPTIVRCIFATQFESLGLWAGYWDGDRGKPPPPGTEADVLHPVKLSISEGYDFTFKFARNL